MIRQLLYISTIRQPFDEASARDILAASRRNNARDGLTGLLVIGSYRFLQLLEGEGDAIGRAYARILGDPRHQACVKLSDRIVANRLFKAWAMGDVAVDEGNGAAEDALVAMIDAIPDPGMRAQFHGFRDIQASAA